MSDETDIEIYASLTDLDFEFDELVYISLTEIADDCGNSPLSYLRKAIRKRRSIFARLRGSGAIITGKKLGDYHKISLKVQLWNLPYDNLKKMMFEKPNKAYEQNEILVNALDKLLILHADHEQNCSTSTVRIVGSSHAGLFASLSAGISALWGPLHGGANQAVLEMLEAIKEDGGDTKKYMAKAKDKEDPFRLMGFGHRVYKNFDPRAKIIKKAADDVLGDLGVEDPVLDIAKGLAQEALSDDYFVKRKLYPNVDFYSGIIYRAMGIPVEMFTVMFALGRLPGWIAQWREMRLRKEPIGRPRQIYIGETLRAFKDIDYR